jgi:hypothetical protein
MIYSSGSHTQGDILDLLQGVFVTEFLLPSPELWFTSPWISDVSIIDNRTDEFTSLVPDWPPDRVRLSEVLAGLALLGTNIHVATRPDEHGARWVQRLREVFERLGCIDRIHVRLGPELHEKGILSSHFYISGSMNITYRGIHVNDEHLRFDTDTAVIGEAYLAFRQRWNQFPAPAVAIP